MGIDKEEAHRGWKRRDDTVEELISWFCQLSTQERLQVSALRLFSLRKAWSYRPVRAVLMLMNACAKLTLARWRRPEFARKLGVR